MKKELKLKLKQVKTDIKSYQIAIASTRVTNEQILLLRFKIFSTYRAAFKAEINILTTLTNKKYALKISDIKKLSAFKGYTENMITSLLTNMINDFSSLIGKHKNKYSFDHRNHRLKCRQDERYKDIVKKYINFGETHKR